VIRSAHQLLQCCAVDALTHRHRPDSGVNPLPLGHRGRHSYVQRVVDAEKIWRLRTLLQPASNHRILLCSPSTAPPRGPCTTRDQRHSQAPGQLAYPYKVPTTRGEVAVHRTRRTLEDRPTRVQRAPSGGQRPW
ncbi:Hypothetical protein GSB_151257, partial [Giardia duodenalis]